MEVKRLIVMIVMITSATQVNSEAFPFQNITCDNAGKITAIMNKTFATAKIECEGHDEYVIIHNNNLNVDSCKMDTVVVVHLFPTSHAKTSGDVVSKTENAKIQRVNITCHMNNYVTVSAQFAGNGNGISLKPVDVTNDPGVTMEITNTNHSTFSGAVVIGSPYTLKIKGPDHYFLMVESCDAAPDNFFNKSVASIYSNGKSNTHYSVLDNIKDNGNQKTLETTLHGFGILDANVVYLRCTVDVCKAANCSDIATTTSATSTPVAAGTPALGRRRRQVNNTVPKKRVTSRTWFRVQRWYLQGNGSKGQMAAKEKYLFLAVALVLKIII